MSSSASWTRSAPTPGPLLALIYALATACGGDSDEKEGATGVGNGTGTEEGDVRLGETTIVAVVNPVPNQGNTAPLPAAHTPALRADVPIDADPGGQAVTNATGLGVVQGLDAGPLDLLFGPAPGAALPFTVVRDGDVYDLAVGYDGTNVQAIQNFPIRYPIASDIIQIGATATPRDLAGALETNGTTVVVSMGRYVGDLTITGDDVLFFGEGFTERAVVIDGSVRVRGTGVRIRGFTITGDLIVEGNLFGMGFTVVQGSTDIRGNAVAFLRNAFCGDVTVPSSSASLFDNEGMPPLPIPVLPCAPPDGGAP
jgi:hypothetical protein